PQLILMDIQMPRLDGLEAIRRLRALPAHAVTPIIALTALAMPGDKERCLEAGATAYLTKPVRMRGLAEMIEQLLHA
ncbi:MAG: response regulator, partial [Oscillochloris sp.]|nr:response regulator [Oscillochloris sp.]